MAVKFFSLLLLLALIYVIAGIVFAIAFVAKGVNTVDKSSHGTSVGFKLLIFPGSVALWPILLSKWTNAKKRE